MKWTKLHTGFLYLLLTVLTVFCGLPDIADAGPKIVKLNNATSGTKLTISCEVDPGILQDETLVYWLVNNSFIETAFPSGRVWMHTHDSMEYIQSDLVFSCVHPQDFQSNFTCVALSPAGVDTKSITLHEIIRNTTRKKAGTGCSEEFITTRAEDKKRIQWMKLVHFSRIQDGCSILNH